MFHFLPQPLKNREPAVSQRMPRVAKKLRRRLTVPSITTGIGRKNMSWVLEGILEERETPRRKAVASWISEASVAIACKFNSDYLGNEGVTR
jgi:hypothetical protein